MTVDKNALWAPHYQARDREVVDYEEYTLPEIVDEPLRGPAITPIPGSYFSCIGAAQTYGVLAPKPYPTLLGERIGLAALNLGFGGAGPGYFARQARMIEYVNKGRFLVLQVMSARAEPNRYYDAAGFRDAVRDRASGQVISSVPAWERLYTERRDELADLARECRAAWLENYRHLVKQITVPNLLFWYSTKKISDRIDFSAITLEDLRLAFPQLIDGNCIEPLKPLCAGLALCESTRGADYPLVSRFTGAPVILDSGIIHPSLKGMEVSRNAHYPSPEMHEDAALALHAELVRMSRTFPKLLAKEGGN